MEYKVQGIVYSVGLMPAGFLSQEYILMPVGDM